MGFLTVLTVSSLMATNTKASEVCKSLNSCRVLQSKVEARIKVLLNVMPQLTDYARDADGEALVMNQHDAEKYCLDQGLSLPTIRQLALVAQKMGAKISDKAADGYSPIYTANSAGERVVDFYYSNSDVTPRSDVWRFSYWSTRFHSVNSDGAYFFFGVTGAIDFALPNFGFTFPVRCAR